MELQELGHEWKVDRLKEEMTAVLMGRRKDDDGWWTVERAFKLYQFVRLVDELKGLTNRAAKILKMYEGNK